MTDQQQAHRATKAMIRTYKKEAAIRVIGQMLKVDVLTAYAIYNDYNENVL